VYTLSAGDRLLATHSSCIYVQRTPKAHGHLQLSAVPSGACLAKWASVGLGLPFVDTYGGDSLGLLGDPTRRAIFELLARRPYSVGELAKQLPISRPAVSQHLRMLMDGGLITCRPEGTRRIYQLNPDGVAALRVWLDRIWDEALTAYQKAAEAAPVDP
jgi:DNA-binding transcriptional ArsR family regulator